MELNQDDWQEILKNFELTSDFDYGSEPTLEQFKETQVAYSVYLKIKTLVELLRCEITYIELLKILGDNWKTTESSSDSFLAVIKERIPTEIMEKIISLLFEEISKDNICITPNDLNVFHKRFGAEISSKAVRKIIHDIDRTNKGKIYIEDFSAFIKTEI